MRGGEQGGERTPGRPVPRFENSQCLTTQYARHTLHPRLFDYDRNGYAYTSPPSSPVYACRPTRTWFEYPKASHQPAEMVQSLQPPIQLTRPIQHRRPLALRI